jgi:hypothetical protein
MVNIDIIYGLYIDIYFTKKINIREASCDEKAVLAAAASSFVRRISGLGAANGFNHPKWKVNET